MYKKCRENQAPNNDVLMHNLHMHQKRVIREINVPMLSKILVALYISIFSVSTEMKTQ